jgi:hypothetical protein
MKLVFRILVMALLVALLAVPAAAAKPGGGHGKGGGKPAWAGGGKGAEKSKAAKEKKAKKDKQAATSGKATKEKQHGKKAAATQACDAESPAAELLGQLFGSAACEADDAEAAAEEVFAQQTEPPDLEGLGPGQYCHQLEAWMVSNGGDFSQTFGTEVSGFANDHGKCASRRAHGEDLLAVAQEALAEQEEEEQQQGEQLELPDLEGLNPAQYCFALAGWMAEADGDFSQTFGTEGSGFANDHGKCVSRRAGGEDLLAVAQEALPEAEAADAVAAPEASAPTGESLDVQSLARFVRL